MQFNPSVFQQAQNMNPEQLKSMTGMFANMSDDQIRQYAQMSGMGNIDPAMLRQSANMMKSMKNDDIKNMTNMAANTFGNKQAPQPQQQKQQPKTLDQQISNDNFPQVSLLKVKGNEAFKLGNYDEASSKYQQAILEIEEIWIKAKYLKNDEKKTQELTSLESQCRLNYCNVKAKQADFHIVKQQALQVLKKDENWKAYFRLGQAFLMEQNYESAISNLEKANLMMPKDNSINELLKEAKEKNRIEVTKLNMKKEQRSTTEIKQKNEMNKNLQQNNKSNQFDQQDKEEELQQSHEQNNSEQKTKLQQQDSQQCDKEEAKKNQDGYQANDEEKKQSKKVQQKLESIDVDSEQEQQQQQEQIQVEKNIPINRVEEGEIQVEEIKENQTEVSSISDPVIGQQFDQFKNMTPEQMDQMSNMMKNMDKNFLRQMMKQQTGMEMTDSQIEMMQNMINPNMLENMKKMDPKQIEQIKATQINRSNTSQKLTTSSQQIKNTNEQNIQQNQEQQQELQQQSQQKQQQQQNTPHLPDMQDIGSMLDPNMINMLFQQLKQNPEMLKAMVSMLGPNHPISGYINRASPQDLRRLIGLLSWLVSFVLFGVKFYNQIRKYSMVIIVLLIAYILFR